MIIDKYKNTKKLIYKIANKKSLAVDLIKYYILLYILFFGIYTGYAQDTNDKKVPNISTTIDFLDYVFEYKNTQYDYFPLEEWEKCIAEIAASGIKKIYLRVNVCGLTIYPSKVGTQYGNQGGWHWDAPEKARLFINTIHKYDPLRETIRLGKKYKMEVWCWENLWDDAASRYSLDIKYPQMAQKYGKFPLMDPFFRNHHEYYWELDPRLTEKISAINQSVRGKTIRKIIFTSGPTNAPCRITSDTFAIYTSSDNITYKKYPNNFTFITTRHDGKNSIIIDNLNIIDRFVKLMHGKNWPGDKSYTMVLDKTYGPNQVFDDKGNEIYSVWVWHNENAHLDSNPLDFLKTDRCAWDFKTTCIGFMTGAPEVSRYFLGVCEFSIPEAKTYRLAKFKELTEYSFDGFMFNLRSHSDSMFDPDNYGYNPVIRQKYLQRYGRDIYSEDFDKEKWQNLKAESVDEFLCAAKKLTGGRSLYISGFKNLVGNGSKHPPHSFAQRFGSIPWHYRQWFQDGSIDGVIMLGDYFPDYFTKDVTGSKPIKIGIFKGMCFGIPKTTPDNFEKFMGEMAGSGLDEIELYETLMMTTHKEYYKIISKYLNSFSDKKEQEVIKNVEKNE